MRSTATYAIRIFSGSFCSELYAGKTTVDATLEMCVAGMLARVNAMV